MHHHHAFHLMHYDVKDKKDLMRHTLFKMIGANLFTVFVPAILYFQLGLSLAEIFLFFGAHSLFAIFFQRGHSADFISRTGTKWSMSIGVMGIIGYMFMLMMSSVYPYMIFIAPLFSAIHTSYFRLAFHYNMSLNRRKEKHLGVLYTRIEIMKTVAAAIGPFIGGYLADVWGLNWMFGVAIVFVLFSFIPFYHTFQKHPPKIFSIKKQKKLIMKNPVLIRYVMSTFASVSYIQYVGAVLWSIALFAFFGSFTKMGMITTITTLIVVGFLYILGRSADQDDKKTQKYINRSAWLQGGNRASASIMLFGGLFSQIGYLFVDTLHRLTYQINQTYLTKLFYDHAGIATEKNPLYLVILRETSIHASKVVFSLIFFVIFTVLGNEVSYLALPFILVVVAVPLQLMLMKYKSPLKSEYRK